EIEKVLRKQQKPILKLAEWNDRLVVSGGAGTGKTLIAMEVARRMAESGRRVALLCYNQLIGNWMRQKIEQTKPALPNLVVGRVISVMSKMSGIKHPDNPSQYYWETKLPQELEERITDPDFNAAASFDYLVLDEAQDILARPTIWQCLTQFLSGGMDKGAFSIFGDFEHQILTEREPINQAIAKLESCNRPVHWKLSENCRNYRIVGDTAIKLAGLDSPIYSGYLRSGGSVDNYDIYFYGNEKEQLDKLDQYLRDFKTHGYKNSEITLLSFRADHLSAAMRLKKAGKMLRPAWQAGKHTTFTSIHAYKGMENKVIIITDMFLDDLEFQRNLFYTGMTRATESVRVLCDENSKETILKWLYMGDDS
ncbi:MAG TPA: DNA/RNA helicase domain-containing protein, partial [Desulfosporosinus sp.]|nr:DNA/RNA helicase domain-containing protein [Desulfosporosinus sp.]